MQVAGLESLVRMLCVEVIELRAERERALASRTLAGHARNFLGYCLSLYCLVRWPLTLLNSFTDLPPVLCLLCLIHV